ncbi:MAG: hypothetical protein IJL30_05340 [Clostridia bacterium]|nr:hypothetical protein [Clostridia bacterium]
MSLINISTWWFLRSKTQKIIIISLAAVLIFAIILVSCGHDNAIIGKWEDRYGNELTFYPDGALMVGRREGSYSVALGKITVEFSGEKHSGTYKIDGNTLVINWNDFDDALRLTKMK